MKEMNGFCFLFSETGTEGGWWAMQKDGFKTPDGYESYEGLEYLEEGDDFTVFGDDGSIIWHGIIHRDSTTGAVPHMVFRSLRPLRSKKKRIIKKREKTMWKKDPTWKQQVVDGLWVHWVQAGMDSEEWGKLFEGNKRCLVKRRD